MKNIAILGSTGSVGRSSLEVIRSNRESYKVELLVANSNFELLIEQYEEFKPRYIYLDKDIFTTHILITIHLDITITIGPGIALFIRGIG